MPLSIADSGVLYIVKQIHGNQRDRHHLEALGIIPGTAISIISKFNGYFLINIKGSRIGLSMDFAKRIVI